MITPVFTALLAKLIFTFCIKKSTHSSREVLLIRSSFKWYYLTYLISDDSCSAYYATLGDDVVTSAAYHRKWLLFGFPVLVEIYIFKSNDLISFSRQTQKFGNSSAFVLSLHKMNRNIQCVFPGLLICAMGRTCHERQFVWWYVEFILCLIMLMSKKKTKMMMVSLVPPNGLSSGSLWLEIKPIN